MGRQGTPVSFGSLWGPLAGPQERLTCLRECEKVPENLQGALLQGGFQACTQRGKGHLGWQSFWKEEWR